MILSRYVRTLQGGKIKGNRIMTTTFHRETARIYQFPVRGPSQGNKRIEKVKAVTGLKSTPYAGVTFGGSWYHEAAIRDAERNPGN
jgi:hypothetical protein